MAADLYPTKTRIALLGDVHHGGVRREYNADGSRTDINPSTDRRVNDKIAEQKQAGWVTLDGAPLETDDNGVRFQYWEITTIGAATLAAALIRNQFPDATDVEYSVDDANLVSVCGVRGKRGPLWDVVDLDAKPWPDVTTVVYLLNRIVPDWVRGDNLLLPMSTLDSHRHGGGQANG